MNQEPSFGQLVRQRRRELDLTQEELARRVGCAAITIRKIEADDARPSVQIAERLAMALAIPLDDRAEFVRRGRAARPEPVEIPTPPPALEEIGLEDLSGRAIRGYALAEKIGTGGMGAVYRAMQPLVEREVAIKIILPAYANHPDFIRRFEAEAQLVARLEHPHIVPLYDYWREPGIAYLVMRLLRGGSVSTLLKDGALPIETINRLLEQVCYALHAAHRIGVVHRDLKPANVLLDEDHNAYLADFGIAKNLGNPNPLDQTDVDMVLGSPAYFSPEQIQSAVIRPQTDIYALGVMLYELLTGTLPFTGPTPFDLIQQHMGAPMPPLAARREGLPGALDAVISRAAAKDPGDRYPDALALLDDFRRAVGGVSALPVFMPVEEEGEALELVNPYKGLRAFGEADVDDYFGRETLIQQLLARLGEGGDLARFLAVVGPSGSGKSSVVGAGLIPALRRGALVGSENWFVVDFLPGAHPFEELEAALLRVAVNPVATQHIASLLSQLKADERGLLRAVRRVLPADNAVELVLVIDQFEEVFTLVTDEAERALFLSSLVTAVLDERSRLRVIITLRADFTDRPLRYVDFGELVQRRSEFVLPLTPDELERAIVGPARRVGLRLESGLVSTMMREVGDQPGALPLLQYALTELFEKRDGRTLTKAAYEAIGGVAAALGRRAEEVYQGLSDAEQAVARQVFLRLVTLGEGVEDTRRRVLRSELKSLADPTYNLHAERPISRVIDIFGRHRLLTFDRDPITRGPTVEVAHEALLREWPRLREWLNESRADVRLQRTLAEDAAQWNAAGRDASYLLIGAHLEQFEGWVASTTVSLTSDERAFLEASSAERDRQLAAEAERQQRELLAARQLAETERARADSEQRRAEEQTRSANRLRMRNRALAVAGALVTVAAIIAIIFGGQANANATRADQNAQQAQANLSVAQANAATAQAASVLAEQQRGKAVDAQATAVANEKLSRSRELAPVALNQFNTDPERGLLLAIEAAQAADTHESQDALRQLLLASKLEFTVGYTGTTINSVQFSRDGKRIVTTGCEQINPDCAEGTARVWDATTGRQLVVLHGHTGLVNAAQFSPDGKQIATASSDKTARVWDATTGQELARLQGHEGPVNSIQFSPDGKQIVTASEDKTARVWDATTGKELVVLRGHVNSVINAQFSPDGKQIVTASDDTTASVWDAATGKELAALGGHAGPINSAQFSPDGKQIVTASDDQTARVWDATTGQELAALRGHKRLIYDAQFSPDGKQIVTASDDSTASVWDAATGKELAVLNGHELGVVTAQFSPDGRQIVTASRDGTARVWDAATGQALAVLRGHTGPVTYARFSPDGSQIVTASNDQTARMWNAIKGQELVVLRGHAKPVNSAQFSPDGKKIVTASDDTTTRIWDVTTGQELAVLRGQERIVTAAQFSPDGKQIVTASRDGTARVRDAATGEELAVLRGHTGPVVGAQFSPDGKQIATASWDGTARVWEAATGKQMIELRGHTGPVYSVSFSPDGKRIVTASDDRTARVWDALTGQKLAEFQGHAGPVNSASFSSDGKQIVTASRDETDVRDPFNEDPAAIKDGTAQVWDAMTGQVLAVLSGHVGSVNSAQFSPDGKLIVTAGDDQTARVWDTATGKELAVLRGHTEPVNSAQFSPDGKEIVTASQDGTARIYLAHIEDLIALARARVTRPLTCEERVQYLLEAVACPTPAPEVKPVVAVTLAPPPTNKKTIRLGGGEGKEPTIDPSLWDGTVFGTLIPTIPIPNETSVGLTRLDEVTSVPQPGLATAWDISADGREYTFHLRTDVPWVKWDKAKGEVVKVQDCNAQDRMVTARDFEYGFLRTLNPKLGAPFAYVLNLALEGAEGYNTGVISDTTEVGVKAVDDQTLILRFKEAAAYNANIAGMWMAHAEPRWLIEGDACTEARGDRWTEADSFQGYGPFTLKEWEHGSHLTLVKNPFWPGSEAIPQSKIEEVDVLMIDSSQALDEFEAGNLDMAAVSFSDMDRVRSDPVLSKQLTVTQAGCTEYVGFNTQAPFVDDARVRRALSMAIDRQSLVKLSKTTLEPAQWLTPQWFAGAPTVADYPALGIKFDPVKAKEELDGYLKEKNLTADQLDITMMYNVGNTGNQLTAESLQTMWKQNLGIDVKLVQQQWRVYLNTITDPKATPQIWRIAWCRDYLDASNFDRDAVASDNPTGGGGLNWRNPDYEKLVTAAARELDPAKRVELYAQAEQILVNTDAAVAPLFTLDHNSTVIKPYVTRTFEPNIDTQYIEKWDIDPAARGQ